MDDNTVLNHINDLADEEHKLYQREAAGETTQEEGARLKQLGVTLDQCWDLLRQRRARRSAGLDPDDAAIRDPNVVERYVG